MPRVKLFDQEEALKKAQELFWEKGYEATSLTDLTDHLGIGKGSFYDTFKGKKALFNKALHSYGQSNIEFLKSLLNSKNDVKEGMRLLFETTFDKGLNDEKHKGCFIANTCSELGNADEEIRIMLVEHNKSMHDILTNYLSSGNLGDHVNIDRVAQFYITFLTGLNQEMKIKREKADISDSIDLLIGLLD